MNSFEDNYKEEGVDFLKGKYVPYNPINEIRFLRNGKSFLINTENSNRYRIIAKDGLVHTAYCFSTPIYNIDSKRLVCLRFDKMPGRYVYKGSNGTMTVCKNRCVLENREGKTVLLFDDSPAIFGINEEGKASIVVAPTMNGFRFIVKEKRLKFLLKSETSQYGISFNSGCFCVMRERFIPFMSIATLYASNDGGVFAPVEIKYSQKEPQIYEMELSHDLQNGVFTFEVNLYEPKLFQDTTVESLNPNKNNAFGAVGFIGKTKQYGEQWLYSRPDFSKMTDLSSDRVDKVLLHIPIFNESNENADVYIPQHRFCSFGSTWNKKVNSSGKVTTSNNSGRYISVDATSMFTNRFDQTLIYNEGLILKKPKGKNNFIAISTGDCYSAPQILEIKFKNQYKKEIKNEL